jgi:hypothetical protein
MNGKTQTGVFKDVLYVPNLGVNLVSIGTAAEKDGVQIIFLEKEVVFSRNGIASIKGSKIQNGLYRLDLSTIPQPIHEALLATPSEPLSTWHE